MPEGACEKLNSVVMNGMPDRSMVFPFVTCTNHCCWRTESSNLFVETTFVSMCDNRFRLLIVLFSFLLLSSGFFSLACVLFCCDNFSSIPSEFLRMLKLRHSVYSSLCDGTRKCYCVFIVFWSSWPNILCRALIFCKTTHPPKNMCLSKIRYCINHATTINSVLRNVSAQQQTSIRFTVYLMISI